MTPIPSNHSAMPHSSEEHEKLMASSTSPAPNSAPPPPPAPFSARDAFAPPLDNVSTKEIFQRMREGTNSCLHPDLYFLVADYLGLGQRPPLKQGELLHPYDRLSLNNFIRSRCDIPATCSDSIGFFINEHLLGLTDEECERQVLDCTTSSHLLPQLLHEIFQSDALLQKISLDAFLRKISLDTLQLITNVLVVRGDQANVDRLFFIQRDLGLSMQKGLHQDVSFLQHLILWAAQAGQNNLTISLIRHSGARAELDPNLRLKYQHECLSLALETLGREGDLQMLLPLFDLAKELRHPNLNTHVKDAIVFASYYCFPERLEALLKYAQNADLNLEDIPPKKESAQAITFAIDSIRYLPGKPTHDKLRCIQLLLGYAEAHRMELSSLSSLFDEFTPVAEDPAIDNYLKKYMEDHNIPIGNDI